MRNRCLALLGAICLAIWPGRAGPPPAAAQATAPAGAAVAFADPAHGWIGGERAIFATTDGGATWTRQYGGPETIREFAFASPSAGWALTSSTLLGTADGGATWTPLTEASTPLIAVARLDEMNGWGVAGPPDGPSAARAGKLARTSDGGRSWELMPSPGEVQSVCFADPARGFAAGHGTVWLTEDAGRGWREVLVSPVVADRLAGGGSDASLWAQVRCADGAAWVLFKGPGGMMHVSYGLYRTADFGVTWQPVAQSNQFPVTGAAYGQGSDLTALTALSAAVAYGAQPCWPCSLPGDEQDQGTVTLGGTRDGGQSWFNGPPVPGLTGPVANRGPYALGFATPTCGFLVVGDPRTVYLTPDGGQSWQPVPMPE